MCTIVNYLPIVKVTGVNRDKRYNYYICYQCFFTMVNRIQEILNRYHLTAAKFADQLDVPRSTISHILSERNKPSLEFIQKVLEHYPEINTDWLVKGVGSIFDSEPGLFSNMDEAFTPSDAKAVADPKEYPSRNEIKENKTETTFKEATPEKERIDELKHKNTNNQQIKAEKKEMTARKKIKRIIAFYSDNTFDEFFPSENPD